MALPSSGVMSLEMIRAYFGGGYPTSLSNYYRGGPYVPNIPANYAIPTGGQIGLSQFYGAVKSSPGSAAYGSPGTYYLALPPFTTISLDARGAGGGGGGSTYDGGYPGTSGAAGGQTAIYSNVGGLVLYADGGSGGDGSFFTAPGSGAAGGGGGSAYINAGSGGSGGIGGTYGFTKGGDGGAGGQAYNTFGPGSGLIEAGHTLTIIIGSGGGPGAGSVNGTYGNGGAFYISWT